MIDAVEDLADDAHNHLLKTMRRVGEQPIQQTELVRCPFCREGRDYSSKWSFLWGGICWWCGGWGAVAAQADLRFSPLQPHPFRAAAMGVQTA